MASSKERGTASWRGRGASRVVGDYVHVWRKGQMLAVVLSKLKGGDKLVAASSIGGGHGYTNVDTVGLAFCARRSRIGGWTSRGVQNVGEMCRREVEDGDPQRVGLGRPNPVRVSNEAILTRVPRGWDGVTGMAAQNCLSVFTKYSSMSSSLAIGPERRTQVTIDVRVGLRKITLRTLLLGVMEVGGYTSY
ncbi:hypothetical protein GOBAR_AA32996 [Gossypium barbadense]|uniref:Uncharacterized protein n=1 Tax=Gossypium barbadense TaxID=3634 RepID=A0A2P5W9C2_GOSBA|nr:hypothetical protein GOBAR_AA32996 [Gossypium barbadense]